MIELRPIVDGVAALPEKYRAVLLLRSDLERRHPQDAEHNTVLANHVAFDTHNCVIVGDADKLIATAGVSDLIIIQDGDAILVAHRKEESNIKKIVEQLKARGLEKHL